MLEVVPDCALLVRSRVHRLMRIDGGQVSAQLVLAVPRLERVLRGIAQLPDRQADPPSKLYVEPHGPKPDLVWLHELPLQVVQEIVRTPCGQDQVGAIRHHLNQG